MARFFLGLGSNLENPIEQLKKARKQLSQIKEIKEIKASSIYKTKPWGYLEQPDFFNAVIEYQSYNLEPYSLLDLILGIEEKMGRIRSFKYAARVIDIDLLTYGDLELKNPKLTIPHPLIKERDFVLIPLLEIAPELEIKGQGLVKNLADKCDKIGVEKLIFNQWTI